MTLNYTSAFSFIVRPLRLMIAIAAFTFSVLSVSAQSSGGGADVIALPVKLEYFNFQLIAPRKLELNWKTAEQFVTNISYELQRAVDGYEFKTIAVLFPPDNSPTPTIYQFRDDFSALNVKNVIFYRIKQIQNSKVSFSDVRAYRISKDQSGVIIKTFPNPATNFLQVNIYSDKKTKGSILAYDMMGKSIFNKQVSVEEGSNNFNIDEVSDLNKGMFFIKVILGDELVKTERIIKQ